LDYFQTTDFHGFTQIKDKDFFYTDSRELSRIEKIFFYPQIAQIFSD